MAGEKEGRHIWIHAILILACIAALYPVLWVAALALSGRQEPALSDLPEDPGALDRLRAMAPVPDQWSLSNFTGLFAELPMGQWIFNSVIISVATTIVGVIMACTAAYAFSRFSFPGRRTGMMMFLVSQMYPATLMMIPLYIIIEEWLGLGDHFLGLVLVYSVTAIPFCVWMLKGYFDTIPAEIEESALMDGASPGRIFVSIVLPLARPALVVTALFSFMTAWNEFILALIFLDEEASYTAPVGLRFLVSDYAAQYGYFAAGSIIVAIPVCALFFALQKFLVSGLTAGGVKG
ncbi:MAG: sugar ABC transporter permease [Pseudomonadota bacterium]